MISEHSSRARGKLKIGDDWNAITIIALSQTSPLKAIAELVENSIDAKARTVTITRGREHRRQGKCEASNPVSMTNSTDRVEIITSVQRRRRWTASEKVRMVEETFEPGMTVSLVARRHGVAPNQLFTWRRPVAQGSLTAAGSGEEVVPASDYRTLQNQVRELHRLLGKKTLEAEILKEALEHATGSKKQLRLPPSPPKDSSR